MKSPDIPVPGARGLAAAALLLLASAPLMAGVTVEVMKPERMYPGTTAFIDHSGSASRIVEIDRDGRTVWEYALPADILPQPRYTSDLEWLPASDHFLFACPSRGIFEVDRAGRVVWKYLTAKVSHDADRLANGNTLFVYGRDADDDAQVTEVSPDGRIVWQWYAKPHLAGETRQDPLPGRREPYSYTRL